MSKPCPFCDNEYKSIATHVSLSHGQDEYKSLLIDEIKRLGEEHDRTPSASLMDEVGQFSPPTYIKVFDSWKAAMEIAGYEVKQEASLTEEQLLDEIRRLKELYDTTPTTQLMHSEGNYGKQVYFNRFESWNEAVEKAGLEVNEVEELSEEFLLEEIRSVADEIGEPPSGKQFDMESKHAAITVIQNFGSWNEGVRKAGLTPKSVRDIGVENLTDELHRMADELGHAPTHRAMREGGKYSTQPYVQEFGSWSNALEAAGYESLGSSMVGMGQSLYVLSLENDKWYVGVSAHPDSRLNDHLRQGRSAAQWAKEHAVEERVELTEPMRHKEAYEMEKEKTLELMREYGWENVRGGPWLSVERKKPPKALSSSNE